MENEKKTEKQSNVHLLHNVVAGSECPADGVADLVVCHQALCLAVRQRLALHACTQPPRGCCSVLSNTQIRQACGPGKECLAPCACHTVLCSSARSARSSSSQSAKKLISAVHKPTAPVQLCEISDQSCSVHSGTHCTTRQKTALNSHAA